MVKKKTKQTGKVTVSYRGASIAEVFHHVHREVVSECEYCGKPLTRSEVNDYGSLCESCYMKEYYANKRIIYKDNIIIEFGSNSYHAFVINQDNDVEDKAFTTLESAKQWIDQYGI